MPAPPDSATPTAPSQAGGASLGPPPEAPSADGAPRALSAAAFSICLAILLAIFVLLHPLWEPMAMEQMDQNILWSYYPIPLLVLAALAIERKLGWAAFWLETLKLTLVKFAITFLFANVMWSYVTEAPGVQESAPPPARVPTSERPFNARQPPAPAPADPAQTGAVSGRVVDAAGAPLADVLVFVADDLATFSWPAPEAAARIQLTDTAITPALTVVQTYQRLLLQSADGTMHTAQATGGTGDMLFNYPVLPGSDRELMFDHPLGEVTLSCRAHETSGGALLVLGHPFSARTDADGRFAFHDVPAGSLEVVVRAADGTRTVQSASLAAGGAVAVEFELP